MDRKLKQIEKHFLMRLKAKKQGLNILKAQPDIFFTLVGAIAKSVILAKGASV